MTPRRDLFKMVAAALFPAGGPIANDVLSPGSAKLDRQPFGDLRIYFNGPTEQLKVLTAGSLALKPGMSPHPPHQHPEEEIMLITEGEGEITLDGKITRVAPGSMMYCAGGRLHGVTAKTPLTFYFYKWRT